MEHKSFIVNKIFNSLLLFVVCHYIYFELKYRKHKILQVSDCDVKLIEEYAQDAQDQSISYSYEIYQLLRKLCCGILNTN